MTTGKAAFVFGASGLVGSNLAKELINNANYSRVYLFVRKILASTSPKIQEIILDNFQTFEIPDIAEAHIFCCLGTTIKKAGTKDEFKKVDFELPVNIANWAKSKGIQTFVVVSSIGANLASSNFYLKTKGEMEQALFDIHFKRLFIVRPSLLLGTRTEFRLGEEVAKIFSGIFNLILLGSLKKYKPIYASHVAAAMVKLAGSNNEGGIFESDKLEQIVKK